MVGESAAPAEVTFAYLAIPDGPARGMPGARLEAGQTLEEGVGLRHGELNRPGSTPGAI
jgi:hypothetical protein